jgi:hypothetical protein
MPAWVARAGGPALSRGLTFRPFAGIAGLTERVPYTWLNVYRTLGFQPGHSLHTLKWMPHAAARRRRRAAAVG